MPCFNITHMQLRGAILYVKNLDRMQRFYCDVLGVDPANHSCTEVWAAFETGDGVRFGLHAIPGDIAKNIEIACPPVPREDQPVKLIFEVKEVERERERLESLGIQTLRRAWQKPGVACDAVDPEGNIFQLCCSA